MESKIARVEGDNPKDLVLLIFDKITQYLVFKDELEVSKVCKILRRTLIPNIFNKVKIFESDYENHTGSSKALYASNSSEVAIFDCFGSKSKFIQSIQFRFNLNNNYNSEFFGNFSNLTIVKFVKCTMTDVVLLTILKTLAVLEGIWLRHCKVEYYGCELFFKLPESLKCLWVQGKMYPLPYNVLKVFNTHTNLTKAYILCHNMIQPFSKNYPSLKHLQIDDCDSIGFDQFKATLVNNNQIETLSVSADLLSWEHWEQIRSMKQLTKFKIFKGVLEDLLFWSIPYDLKYLIIDVKVSDYTGYSSMSYLQNLVEIYFNFKLSQSAYQEILKLKKLRILSFKEVNPSWVRRLTQIPSIKRLTWLKNPHEGYIKSIRSRAYTIYNIQYINGKFNIII